MSNKREKPYQFWPSDAVKYGIDKAVILWNIRYWLDKNLDNNKNIKNGFVWTYNSGEAFAVQFSWLKPQKIRRLLRELEDDDIILSANHNKASYDRTKWYTIPSEFTIVQNETMECSDSNNALSKNEQPIPDDKPDVKHTNNKEDFDFKKLVNDAFHKAFWPTWLNIKKKCDSNTGPKTETFEKKWKPLFNKSYFKNKTEPDFRDEVECICEFAEAAHAPEGFNRFINMGPGKFFTEKQWRDN